jgi:hypothetical protein
MTPAETVLEISGVGMEERHEGENSSMIYLIY